MPILRMITIYETVIQTARDGIRSKYEKERAYVTDMSVPQFVARLNAHMTATCERFGVLIAWHIINVIELGEVSPADIAAMQSPHFSASLWLTRHDEPRYLDAWEDSE